MGIVPGTCGFMLALVISRLLLGPGLPFFAPRSALFITKAHLMRVELVLFLLVIFIVEVRLCIGPVLFSHEGRQNTLEQHDEEVLGPSPEVLDGAGDQADVFWCLDCWLGDLRLDIDRLSQRVLGSCGPMELLVKGIAAMPTSGKRGMWPVPLVLGLLSGCLWICWVPDFSSSRALRPRWPLQSP